MAGLLNVSKPRGISSAAVVGRLRRSSGIRRVGHAGTLDPMATGVLPLLFGRATVLADRLSARGKSYQAGIRLGARSTTDDAEGELTAVAVPEGVDAAAVEAALAQFVGEIQQVPPQFSAIKVEGRRSYRLARGGVAVALAPRAVRVDAVRLVGVEPGGVGDAGPLVTVSIECGPGFYVRALARDLGEALGTAGHVETLERTAVAGLRAGDAVSVEAAEALGPGLAGALLPLDEAVAGLGQVSVDVDGAERLARGMAVDAGGATDGDAYASREGRVLALGAVRDGAFHPHRLVQL